LNRREKIKTNFGNVSLALSSNNEGAEEIQEMDAVFKLHADSRWYKSTMSQEECNLKAFPKVLEVISTLKIL
jgi:hypothetical protein